MAKYNFQGATIGTTTIIEQQFGTLHIRSGSVMPVSCIDEAAQRVRTIRADLLALDQGEPGVDAAVGHVNQALGAIEGPSQAPDKAIGHLKAAATALVETGKTVSAATTIINAVGQAAAWIASVVV